jgi:hypothetical protein
LVKEKLQGTDWAGRPLGGTEDVLAETLAMGMPAPFGDLPRYAAQAHRADNPSFLAEGIMKMLEPQNAIPVLAGLQPHVSSKDPTTSQEALAQSKDVKKIWADAERVKNLSKNMSPPTRDKQIEYVLSQAHKIQMSPRELTGLSRYLHNQEISRGQRAAARAYEQREQNQLNAPPGDSD